MLRDVLIAGHVTPCNFHCNLSHYKIVRQKSRNGFYLFTANFFSQPVLSNHVAGFLFSRCANKVAKWKIGFSQDLQLGCSSQEYFFSLRNQSSNTCQSCVWLYIFSVIFFPALILNHWINLCKLSFIVINNAPFVSRKHRVLLRKLLQHS